MRRSTYLDIRSCKLKSGHMLFRTEADFEIVHWQIDLV